MAFFFFNDTATTEIYTLSLHDALPILSGWARGARPGRARSCDGTRGRERDALPRSRRPIGDRKSTRLNSSHANISYAVFCLKKKMIPLPIIRSLYFLTSLATTFTSRLL